MADILLNDSDRTHLQAVQSRLKKEGHQVWTANELLEINSILNDAGAQVMILDLDQHNLNDLMQFAERWSGIKIVFQASNTTLKYDFRSWIADAFVAKSGNGAAITSTVERLLAERTNGNGVHDHSAEPRPHYERESNHDQVR